MSAVLQSRAAENDIVRLEGVHKDFGGPKVIG